VILGSLIVDESLYNDISDMIHPSMFSAQNEILAKCFFELIQTGEKLRKVKVARWLIENNKPNECLNIFDGLMSNYSEDDFLGSCLSLRKNFEVKQRVLSANAFLINAQNEKLDSSLAIDYYNKDILLMNDILESTKNAISYTQQVDNTFSDIEKRMTGVKTVGIQTGIKGIDEFYGGFDFGSLVIIAAASGIGKTTLALQVILNTIERGTPAKIFSLEMSYKGLIEKLTSMKVGINAHRIHLGNLNNEEVRQVSKAMEELKQLPLSIFNTAKSQDKSISTISNEITVSNKRDGTRLFCIDYLGLVKSNGTKFGKDAEYEEIANELKTLANSLDVTIILLAQFNRSSQQTRQRPKLTDIKYGSETAADIIISPYIDMTEDDLLQAREAGIVKTDLCFTKHRMTGVLKDFAVNFITDSNKYEEFESDLWGVEKSSNLVYPPQFEPIKRDSFNEEEPMF
jgi:replicative DNA helicase